MKEQVLAGLEAALAFLGRGDVWGAANPEQVPLFSPAGFGSWAWVLFGALGSGCGFTRPLEV